MRYELFYLVGASREAELENIRKDVNEIVVSNDGVFEEKETMEKRKLSYKIKHETHGIYIAQRLELEETEKMKSIHNKLNLHPAVLRFVISNTEELPALKSKEERISESLGRKEEVREREITRKEKPVEKIGEGTTQPKKEISEESKKETADQPTKTKEPKSSGKTPKENDDIDKKLEEILNI